MRPAALAAGLLAAALPAAGALSAGPRPDPRAAGALPVLHQGRVKPLDTVARSALLVLRGKQTVAHEGRRLSALEWLLDVLARPAQADVYEVFRIDDPELRAALGLGDGKQRYFSYKRLEVSLEELGAQAERAAKVEAAQRSRFERAAVNLSERVLLYQRLRHTLQTPDTEDLPQELAAYGAALERGPAALEELHLFVAKWSFMAQAAGFAPLPPPKGESPSEWTTMGRSLIDAAGTGRPHPGTLVYASLARAWRNGDSAAFRQTVEGYRGWLDAALPRGAVWARIEAAFNRLQPFTAGMALYLVAFALVFASWLTAQRRFESAALGFAAAAFAVHTAGLLARMAIEGRPPVTNLYSSAVFVGWIGSMLGLLLERRFRGGLGSLAASALGFVTLIIAHHLAAQGDSLEVMRAVLDSNFWLATHVVAITVGYGSTFLAGLLAHVYILRGALTRSLSRETAATLTRMTYGVVCFSLFFSFVGTVLGGIWADQSWGRFWGWDPKENGALLIVLWNAIILHARWGGYIRDRGLMVMAVFGNVATSLSWFGVNMLGIGLHSYGFMEEAFLWLAAFIATQVAVAGVGALPPGRWRSPVV